MRQINIPAIVIVPLIAASLSVYAQNDKAAVQKKLESQYSLTQPTADNTDIVTAGSILVLKRGRIMMSPVTSSNPYQNTYKDGNINQNAIGKLFGGLKHVPGASAAGGPDIRTFVPGEKMWLTKVSVKDDGIVFDLFTDAFSDIRYKATLRFAFPRGATPTPDRAEQLVAEVFSIQPSDDDKSAKQAPAAGQQAAPAGGQQAAAAPAAPAEQADAPPPPIAPPPPPADAPPEAPKTIKLGQTVDQVVAIFGQPQKVVKLSTKQIYVYPDMKVTFVGGKVSTVN